MKRVRVILFWFHLVLGVAGGLFIGIMSLTGAVLAFATEITAFADGDSSKDHAPSGELSIDARIEKALADKPGAKVVSVSLKRGGQALYVSFGQNDGRYVSSDGSVAKPGGARARATLETVEDLHRALGATSGKKRDVMKAITGGATLAFVFLCLTGIWLWVPKRLKNLRAVAWFRRGLGGKARDFNWHNTIGIWCVPVLLVLSVSGVVISYRWASDAVYRVAGESPPAQPPKPQPLAGDKPLPLEALFERVKQEAPNWTQISIRVPPPKMPMSFSVKDERSGPAFTSRSIVLQPFTGEVTKTEGYSSFTRGRRMRVWMRFLHTGQAFGLVGEVLAFIACIGAVVLVYSGIALSIRRLFGRLKRSRSAVDPAAAPV